MSRPLVSTIILNYNYERYLREAVESVLSQNLPAGSHEIIIVDDGSTDGSSEVIRPYLDRVRWIEKPNGGQVSAFNVGFAAASGEFVALLESDDAWAEGKLTSCLERLRAEPGAALVQHWLEQVDGVGRPLPGFNYPAGPERIGVDEFLRGSLPFIGSSCVVFRADALKPSIPFPAEFLFGADICLRLAAGVLGPIAIIPRTLGFRRIHGKNLFGTSLYDDPAKLERTLVFHQPFQNYMRRILAEHAIHVEPSIFRQLDAEQFQMSLMLNAYRGRICEAVAEWLRLLRQAGTRPYALFKAVAWFPAIFSPRLFLRMQTFYASSALLRWRKRWLPL